MADEADEDSTLQFLASGAGRKGLRRFPFMPFATIPHEEGMEQRIDRSAASSALSFSAFSLIRGEHRPRLDSAMREVILAFVVWVLSRQS
jgi:hypothetical protein